MHVFSIIISSFFHRIYLQLQIPSAILIVYTFPSPATCDPNTKGSIFMTTNESERDRLCRLYIERHKEFEAAKKKRVTITILGFAVFYFYIFWSLGKPTGWFILLVAVIALLCSFGHFWLNLTIFGYLSRKGHEEAMRLESIRNQIKEIDRKDGVDRRSLQEIFEDGIPG
jgi:hypothetical protein